MAAAMAAPDPLLGVRRGAEPIRLDRPSTDRAVLLVHGFGDTPQSLGGLTRRLHAAGWAAHAPLLPGHGRDLRALSATSAECWMKAVRAEHAALLARYARVAVVGQSMGGALAVLLAAELGATLPALVLLAPYVVMSATVRWGARLAPLLARVAPVLSSAGGRRSIHDPEALAASLGGGMVTPALVRELAAVARQARAALGRVRAPTLSILSRQDNRVDPRAAAGALARLGAAERELVWLEGCGHVIAVDHERERVFALTRGWLERHMPVATRDA